MGNADLLTKLSDGCPLARRTTLLIVESLLHIPIF